MIELTRDLAGGDLITLGSLQVKTPRQPAHQLIEYLVLWLLIKGGGGERDAIKTKAAMSTFHVHLVLKKQVLRAFRCFIHYPHNTQYEDNDIWNVNRRNNLHDVSEIAYRYEEGSSAIHGRTSVIATWSVGNFIS